MGIKGIYKEIGPGRRESLAKLAVTTLEHEGRPLRIAIDISIWQFQTQAARGGANPAIRTLFYRLLRLLSLSIQPIFVFDGPNKPAFKRNKRSGRGDGLSTAMAKRLLNLFGCLVHDAPGEAEAECALLQQHGIVDAVLSEDVDTIMFGCTRTLRNWSAEGTKGSKAPTHVSIYETQDIARIAPGLDREGMVLVALMSGGDYIPEGIPGAGIKLACEAAKAGFGTSLCRLKRADTSALTSWKEWLIYELRTNESGFFRVRHKALSIPEDFPNFDILRYYTHPVVSPQSVLETLRQKRWQNPINVPGLREFSRETFDWDYRGGAFKFIRVLAPVLLVQRLMDRSGRPEESASDVDTLATEEKQLVRAVSSRRAHFSTDATPELRVSFIPTEIVGHAFEEEPEEVIESARDGLALNSDDDVDAEDGDLEANSKAGGKKPFSPTEPDLAWIPETVAKLGIPLTVEDWEAAQRAKLSRKGQKVKTTTSKAGKAQAINNGAGSLDKFVRVTKPLPGGRETAKDSSVVPPGTQSTFVGNLAAQTYTPFSPTAARPSKSNIPPTSNYPNQRNRGGRTTLGLPGPPPPQIPFSSIPARLPRLLRFRFPM
ncbi:PIN domain-like protein [Microdochium trichocladiopsis]|uniref:PIN domain-like protein n=1 Tax=Microdochium trichocladiopsis TaxID=1682393 RepID=A0A9P8YH36_9PEZI|nr:PIN domain-like protein [Microdochium trichocladiopsis]KAH7040401.1 PIN domain-like protein [Microdochium trichocladiopsis]